MIKKSLNYLSFYKLQLFYTHFYTLKIFYVIFVHFNLVTFISWNNNFLIPLSSIVMASLYRIITNNLIKKTNLKKNK